MPDQPLMPSQQPLSSIPLSSPLPLPCGSELPNRLVKAAMTEQLAGPDNRANERHERLYRTWGHGGCGMLLTGNLIVDPSHLEAPGNVVICGAQPKERLDALRKWQGLDANQPCRATDTKAG